MGGRPLIGVTGPDRGGAVAWQATRSALRRAGGRARRLTPGRARGGDDIDGLVLGGGADISPVEPEPALAAIQETFEASRDEVRAGRSPKWTLVRAPATLLLRRWMSRSAEVLDPRRDAYERRLLERAQQRRIPVLGICRGAQLLNLAHGGTLHADIGVLLGETPRPRTVLPRVPIDVDAESALARYLGTRRLRVNALHHQSVETTAGPLVVVARDSDGIVQAIESRDHRFVVGVQWHPEYMPQHRHQRSLFLSFVRACRE